MKYTVYLRGLCWGLLLPLVFAWPYAHATLSYKAQLAQQDVLNTLAEQHVLLRNLVRRALRPALADAFQASLPRQGILQQLQHQTQARLTSAQAQFQNVFHADAAPHNSAKPPAAPIYAQKGGDVTYIGRLSGYGQVIIVQYSKQRFGVYGGLERVMVRRGDAITAGTLLGQLPDVVQPRFLYEERP